VVLVKEWRAATALTPAPIAVAPPKVDVDAHGAWLPDSIGDTGDIIVVGCVEDLSVCVGRVVVVEYVFGCGIFVYALFVGGEWSDEEDAAGLASLSFKTALLDFFFR